MITTAGISEEEDAAKTIETYRELIAASNTGAWEYFIASRRLNCNEVYFSLLGRSSHEFELQGDNLQPIWIDLLHPDDVAAATNCFERYVLDPQDQAYENFFRMLHANGSWVWIWSRGRYIKDKDGRNTDRIIGTHTDATAVKTAEEETQRERLMLRTLIDNLPDTIYIKDVGARKIIANKADVKAIGAASEAAVLGKTDLELFNNEIGLRGYQDDLQVLASGVAMMNKEELFYDPDGTPHWLLTSKVPVRDESGKVTRILGIGHHITERKKNEEALRNLNTELQALNQQLTLRKEQELEQAIARGKFEIASEVLHDIGNALVGFSAYLNRIKRVLDRFNTETVIQLASFIQAQQSLLAVGLGEAKSNALASLTAGLAKTQADNKTDLAASVTELMNILSHIQDILSIQRQFVKGHEGNNERKAVNLANVIEDCRAMLNASLEKKKITLNVEIATGVQSIKGDHTKLMQVLLNVIKNSIEAMDEETADKRISISLKAVGERLELNIADNGKGFDAATGSRFFQRGFTTKESGTGLGLYNCRTVIDSHGGSFVIESDGPGLGTITRIVLYSDARDSTVTE
ncbi:PAS domain-containing protein [Mucilaginibacter sp. ZT4R22]|uniref:histidine kinase n=1 Tax=Mucilaginibacter pankratovii TaxID=2772110 RepID=A0ABR7WTI8_9SPHI|nr:PAS domain-containing protein [Mucilaginibacter pankratovii]MBD1365623.1 PAS domain-containing protein [Mucilaginibacter pankratovii]